MASHGHVVNVQSSPIEIEPIKCDGCKGQFQQIQDMDQQLIHLQGQMNDLQAMMRQALKKLSRLENELLEPIKPNAKPGQRNILT